MSLRLRIFVISLSTKNKYRRQFVESSLRDVGLEFTFFEATDGTTLDHNWIEKNVDLERRKMYYSGSYPWLTKCQFGCADSHRRLARDLLIDDADAYLVLEDDVSLKKDFFMNWDSDSLLAQHDLVLLNYSQKIKRLSNSVKSLPNGYRLHVFPSGGVQLASAYLINKSGAQMVVDYQYPRIRAGADNWDWFIGDKTGRCAIVYPKPVTTGFFESSIRKSGIVRRMVAKFMKIRLLQWPYSERQRRKL